MALLSPFLTVSRTLRARAQQGEERGDRQEYDGEGGGALRVPHYLYRHQLEEARSLSATDEEKQAQDHGEDLDVDEVEDLIRAYSSDEHKNEGSEEGRVGPVDRLNRYQDERDDEHQDCESLNSDHISAFSPSSSCSGLMEPLSLLYSDIS